MRGNMDTFVRDPGEARVLSAGRAGKQEAMRQDTASIEDNNTWRSYSFCLHNQRCASAKPVLTPMDFHSCSSRFNFDSQIGHIWKIEVNPPGAGVPSLQIQRQEYPGTIPLAVTTLSSVLRKPGSRFTNSQFRYS